MEKEKIKVLRVDPGKEPEEKEIDSSLESLQQEVGGYIECLYPFNDDVGIICNEEGKLRELEYNRGVYDENGVLCDVIAGPFLVVGLADDTFDSLNDVMMEKYKKHFLSTEIPLLISVK